MFRIFYFLLLFIPVQVFCAPLTLDEVLNSVDQYYPIILASEAELRKAQAEHVSAQGGFDPVLKSNYLNSFVGYYHNNYTDIALEQPTPFWGSKIIAGWRSGQGNFPIYDAKMATFTNGEFRAAIEVPLLKGGSVDERRTKIRVTETGIQAAKEGLESKRLEVQKQATQKYWDWLAAGRKIGVAKKLLDIALDRDEAIRKRIKHGDLPAIDQTDNQRSILQRQAGVVAAERYFQQASLELSIYYRNTEGDPSIVSYERVPQSFSLQELEQAIQVLENKPRSVRNHPEIKKIGSQILQFESELNLAKNQVLPKLDFYLGLYSDFGVNPGTSYLPSSYYPTEMRAIFTLEIPLLFRSSRGKLASSRALLDKTEMAQRLTSDTLEMQVRNAIQTMKAAYEKLKLAQEEVRLSEKLEDSERTRALHGDSSFLLVNLREQGTRDAMGKEIEAYSEFFKAKAEYEAATATY